MRISFVPPMRAVSNSHGSRTSSSVSSLTLVELHLHFFGSDLVIHKHITGAYFPAHLGSRFSMNARMPSCASDVFINSSR